MELTGCRNGWRAWGAGARSPGSRGAALTVRVENGLLIVNAEAKFANHWIYVIPEVAI